MSIHPFGHTVLVTLFFAEIVALSSYRSPFLCARVRAHTHTHTDGDTPVTSFACYPPLLHSESTSLPVPAQILMPRGGDLLAAYFHSVATLYHASPMHRESIGHVLCSPRPLFIIYALQLCCGCL